MAHIAHASIDHQTKRSKAPYLVPQISNSIPPYTVFPTMVKFIVLSSIMALQLLLLQWSHCCDAILDNNNNTPSSASLHDLISTHPNLTRFAEALETAGFVNDGDDLWWCSTNHENCTFTVFAPTNDAFDQWLLDNNNPTMLWLLSPPWILHLRNLLAMHVMTTTTSSSDGAVVVATTTTPTATDEWTTTSEQRYVMRNREIVRVRGPYTISTKWTPAANVTETTTTNGGGVLHHINAILQPWYMKLDVMALGHFFDQDFSILTEFCQSVGLVGIYRHEFTLLAPTDTAFLALGPDVLADLRNDTEKLRQLVLRHVIYGVHPSHTLTDGLVLSSLNGRNLTVRSTGSDITTIPTVVRLPVRDKDFDGLPPTSTSLQVNGVHVVFPNVLARNGLAHVVDQVLQWDSPTEESPVVMAPPTMAPTTTTTRGSIFDTPRMPPI